MKLIAFVFIFILSYESSRSQQKYSDSLHYAFQTAKEDSDRVYTLNKLSEYYSYLYPDSALYYAEKIIELSRYKKYAYGEAQGYIAKGEALDRVGDYPAALEMAIHSLDVAKTLSIHKLFMMGQAIGLIAHLNSITGYFKEAVPYYHESIDLLTKSGEQREYLYIKYFGLAFTLLRLDKSDSAIFYIKKGGEFLEVLKKKRFLAPWLVTGNVYSSIGKLDTAEIYFREGIKLSLDNNALFIRTVLYHALGNIYYKKEKMDSCIYYVRQSLILARKYNYKLFAMEASGFLAYIYDSSNKDSTLKYLKIMLIAKDEAFSDDKMRQFQLLQYENEKRETAVQNAKTEYRNQVRMYALIAALAVFLFIALIFWRNSKQKQKANVLLKEQKEKIENTLTELKSTQAQLIQSEKMASVGQLTAGIAHEIQNPLNFINNFSEINKELLTEMNEEIEKGNYNEVKTIATGVIENQQKINHHGKRADGIVKNMLQYSRGSVTSAREPTDLNKLADEYLRLSYHGLRAKDNSFNATLKTEFDDSIGEVNIVPQDMGRMILNLITNAFYVIDEKKKLLAGSESFEPTVTVTTKKLNDKVKLTVKDNGNGIPQKLLDKIFQPFFTTKPTGQGTGLGLSLAYDIVKAHGGEINVLTEEGKGTEFVITFPV